MDNRQIETETHQISDRESWLHWRASDITASEIGALFKAPPTFKSARDIYNNKVLGEPADIDNEAMRRGRWLEPCAPVALSEVMPEWHVEKSNIYIRAPKLRLGSTPDYVNQHGEPIEVKNPMGDGLAHWDDEPPLGYQLQALQQAMLLDAPRAWVLGIDMSSYGVGCAFYEIPRNSAAEERIIKAVDDFWWRVARGDPPAHDPELDAQTVLRSHPKDDGTAIDLTSDNRLPGLLAEREILKSDRKNADTRIREIDTEIKGKIGDAEFALVSGFDVSWKTQHRKSYTVGEADYRVLRVKDLRPESEKV